MISSPLIKPTDISDNINSNAEKKKKQRDPMAFILGDDKLMSTGKKVSGLPARLVLAIDLAIENNMQEHIQTAQEFKKAIEVYSI